MFELVADVARYPEFLPWVSAIRVRSNSESRDGRRHDRRLQGLRETFTSQAWTRSAPGGHAMSTISTARSSIFSNDWGFRPDGQGGCLVDFSVDFAFKNRVFEMLAGQMFDRALRKMIGAFEERAARLYGDLTSASSAPAPRPRHQQLERAQRRLKADRRRGRYSRNGAASATMCSGSAPRTAWANTTVPTGFFSLPPSGPAMPVIATATSASVALERAAAPCPMRRRSRPSRTSPARRCRTLSTPCLASFE